MTVILTAENMDGENVRDGMVLVVLYGLGEFMSRSCHGLIVCLSKTMKASVRAK